MHKWSREDELARSLVDACGVRARGRVSAGISARDRVLVAAVDFGAPNAISRPEEQLVPLGCFAKLFTAMLVAQATIAGDVALDEPVTSVLPRLPARAAAHLDATTVRQLMNHTHGLDGTGIARAPTTADGFVDVEILTGVLARSRRLASPGALFSYGSIGSWIAAAALEYALRRRYVDLLFEQIMTPLAIAWACPTSRAGRPAVCPSTGGDFSVSLSGLVRFATHHLRGGADPDQLSAARLMRERPVELPGWSFESGACLGWKYYGSGWYGHNSLAPGSSASMRIHPESQAGLVVASDNNSSFLVLARLFGNLLPEFKRVGRPKPIEPDEESRRDLDLCVGTYRNEVVSVSITRQSETALTLEARSLANAEKALSRTELRPSRERIFVATSPASPEFTWLQFLRPAADGYQYLWNGRQIWARAEPG